MGSQKKRYENRSPTCPTFGRSLRCNTRQPQRTSKKPSQPKTPIPPRQRARSLEIGTHVWVMMKEHNIVVDESLSLDLRRYVHAMQYSLSGNVAWSLACPRYHAEGEYKKSQLMRMKHGIKKYPVAMLLSSKRQRSRAKAWSALLFTTLVVGLLLWGSSSWRLLESQLSNVPSTWWAQLAGKIRKVRLSS